MAFLALGVALRQHSASPQLFELFFATPAAQRVLILHFVRPICAAGAVADLHSGPVGKLFQLFGLILCHHFEAQIRPNFNPETFLIGNSYFYSDGFSV